MAEAALQTEITIIDRASAAFETIDKAARVASDALDIFLGRIDAINAKLSELNIPASAFDNISKLNLPTSAFDDIDEKLKDIENLNVSVEVTPRVDAPATVPPVIMAGAKSGGSLVPKDNMNAQKTARQMADLEVELEIASLESEFNGLLAQIDEMESSLSELADEGEEAFEAIGDAVNGDVGQVSDLKGGFLDFAAKAGPALFAIEEGLKFVGSAAEKAIEAISRGDEIAKTSRALHIDAQAFQELDYAIQRGGGSSQDFSGGIRTLNKQIAELKKGSSTAREAFGRLGLSLQDVESLGLEGTLYAVSDALHDMGDAADVDDIMQTLLGRGGYKLAAAFSVGSEELDNLREQARETGTILQDDALAMSEQGADKLLDATLSLQSVWQNISNAIMPTVVNALDNVSSFFKDHQDSIAKIEKLVSRTIGLAIDGVLAIADKLSWVVDAIGGVASFLGDVFDIVGQGIDEMTISISGPDKEQQEAQQAMASRMIQQQAQIGGLAYAQRLRMIGEIQAQRYVLEDQLNTTKILNTNIANWKEQQSFSEGQEKGLTSYLQDYMNIEFKEWAKKQPGAQSWTNAEAQQAFSDFEMSEWAKTQSGSASWTTDELLQNYTSAKESGLINNGISTGQELLDVYTAIDNSEKEVEKTKEEIVELEKALMQTSNSLNTLIASFSQSNGDSRIGAFGTMEESLKAKIDNDRAKVKTLQDNIRNGYASIDVYNERTAKWQEKQSELAKGINHNTRKVKIDKDSILFMKQMATAEIINKYNTVNSTVNANFNSNERYSEREVTKLSRATVNAAAGAARG